MKEGDLVKVSCNTYTGFGYIKGFSCDEDYVLVGFIGGKRIVWIDDDGDRSIHDQEYFLKESLTLLKGE